MNRYEKVRSEMLTCLGNNMMPAITPNGLLTRHDKNCKPSDFLNDNNDYVIQFELCRLWLQDAKFTQRFTKYESTSYAYKHTVEGASKYYVCNGALLLAARSMDLKMRYEPNSPNAQLKISHKWHESFREIHESSTRYFQRKVINFLFDPSLDLFEYVQGWRASKGDKILTMTDLRAF
jgi:hypothetical protein